MKKLYLVDVSSLFFRAFYAVRPLTSPSGLPVNAIYGFVSMLLKLIKEENPEYLVFCHDRKEPSFRKEMYSEYKANRSEMPEDLVPQVPYLKKWAEALGICSVDALGFEADDVIGTLVRIAEKNSIPVVIVSGDKDFAQLVTDQVQLFDTKNPYKMGPAQVLDKWGVRPDQMIDYLALVGDSSDNVPGVTGVGPKGATKLLQEFETLDGIYANVDKIKGSLHDKLLKDKEMAYLSKKLVEIHKEAPISQNFEDYHLKSIDHVATLALLGELNFKGFEKTISELPSWGSANTSASGIDSLQANYRNPVDESSDTKTSEDRGAEQETIARDSVATDESQVTEAELGLGSVQEPWLELGSCLPHQEITMSDLDEILIPQTEAFIFRHELGLVVGHADQAYLIQDSSEKIRDFFKNRSIGWKGHDLKSLWHDLDLNITSRSVVWDSLLGSYVIRAGEVSDFSSLVTRHLGRSAGDLVSPAERLMQMRGLEQVMRRKLLDQQLVLEKLELPLIQILYAMEKRGVGLDTEVLRGQSQEITAELARAELQIQEMAGESFNVASPKQLAVILFDKLRLPPGKKTKTGYSTDSEVLEGLLTSHPIIKEILIYRELSKLKSTYVDALPLLIKEDGRLHTTFNQALTTTGRLSSTEPNLQNIPIKTLRGARVREAFVAKKGFSLLSVDYSQIELRILAHYSQDAGLIAAFENDLDIHSATASEVFGVPLSQVTSEQRRAAKAVNFGIAYGQGAFGLAETLGISRTESSSIIKRYFERFSGVKSYIEDTTRLATEKGFVETLDGRRRYLDELKSNNPVIRKFGERAAINAPIQGTAADLVKKAMIALWEQNYQQMVLQVHDELLFEDEQDHLKAQASEIVKTMEQITKLRVPLKAHWAIGSNWGEAH